MREANAEQGLVLEFGVYSGTTVNHIANSSGWRIDAFDSFEGLPETWRDGYEKGKFARGKLPEVADNVCLHVGLFDNSLPEFLNSLENSNLPIKYLHIDSDLYSSAKTIFDQLGNRIVAGSVIVFDEYFNYPGWKNGEFKAFQEFVDSK